MCNYVYTNGNLWKKGMYESSQQPSVISYPMKQGIVVVLFNTWSKEKNMSHTEKYSIKSMEVSLHYIRKGGHGNLWSLNHKKSVV